MEENVSAQMQLPVTGCEYFSSMHVLYNNDSATCLKGKAHRHFLLVHAQLKALMPMPMSHRSQWITILGLFVYEDVGEMRISQFFDMVVDWPDSLPALRDVKESLAHTNLQSHFISSFRTANQQRLLHAGMLLPDIFTGQSDSPLPNELSAVL